MTIKTGIFNSVGGDRRYDASFFASYFASFVGNGIFAKTATNLQVVASENMTIAVKSGKGWIDGYYIENDADYSIELDISNGTLKRIDRVVMQLNLSERAIKLVVKKGIEASTPVAPALTRNSDIKEYALADIFVNNATIAITQANITDTRFNDNLCGIVKGLDEVDTTNLFAQYDAEFHEWFEDVQGIFDGDVAGNLYNLINTKVDDVLEIIEGREVVNSTSVPIPTPNTKVTYSVSFGKTFASAPVVTHSLVSSTPENITHGIGNVTTTGFNFYVIRNTTTSVLFHWRAVER